MTQPAPFPAFPPAELENLAARGVIIPAPELVAIATDVPLGDIASGAVLHPFTRLSGGDTRIGGGAIIGPGGPATLENAWIGSGAVIGNLGPVTLKDTTCGPGTVLGCGHADRAVFLGREGEDLAFTTGYGFRVRQGCLYEEGASSAQHTDTKMTILFPFVTLGSNINWCDLLVAGGHGPGLGEFSEVGSGVIHFNFTPRGDKATGSAFGNVVRGVFLDQPRLFLGGNGSMVGPMQVEFGAMTGAGGRYGGALGAGLNPPHASAAPPQAGDFDPEIFGSIKRVFDSQVVFIGELAALLAWYGQGRAVVAQGDPDLEYLYTRAREAVEINLAERIGQLGGLAARMERSAALLEKSRPGDARIAQQRALMEHWPKIEARLQAQCGQAAEIPPGLQQALREGAASDGKIYTKVVRGLPPKIKARGVEWLRGISDAVAAPDLLGRVPRLD